MCQDPGVPPLRVMTYNILMGGRHGRFLDQAVQAAAPDVVLVNESPKMPLLWRWQALGLVERWGMTYVTGGRRAGSNLIAVGPAVTVKASAAVTIPGPLFQPRRGIASAQLKVRGSLVGVVACHLSLDAERRRTEVDRILDVADRLRGTVLVGGDLNEGPRGPSWRRLQAAGYVDHGSDDWLTFPADVPTKRIDALVTRGAARVRHHGDPGVDAQVLARASDHRPVLAVLDL
jgi:endonuclease/exonuclease/phosphatase family metal-dependent hydrolase